MPLINSTIKKQALMLVSMTMGLWVRTAVLAIAPTCAGASRQQLATGRYPMAPVSWTALRQATPWACLLGRHHNQRQARVKPKRMAVLGMLCHLSSSPQGTALQWGTAMVLAEDLGWAWALLVGWRCPLGSWRM